MSEVEKIRYRKRKRGEKRGGGEYNKESEE